MANNERMNKARTCGQHVTTADDISWISIRRIHSRPFWKTGRYSAWFASNGFRYTTYLLSIIFVCCGINYCLEFYHSWNASGQTPGSGSYIWPLGSLLFLLGHLILYHLAARREIARLRRTIEYIENMEDPAGKLVHRILFHGKMGLYDCATANILLPARYTYIEYEGYGRYFIVKKNKCGLYSVPQRKFLLNCMYDEIRNIREDVATVVQKGKLKDVMF